MNLYWVKNKTEKLFLTSDLFVGSDIALTNEVMYTPSISFSIPIEVLKDNGVTEASFEFILEFDSGRFFQGKVIQKEYDIVSGVVTLSARHIVDELTHYRIPTNYAVSEKSFEEIYNTDETLQGKFNHEGWTFRISEDIKDIHFTYLFSNQDKLTALTDACKQTEDVFWRVSLTEPRTIEIGRFGEYKELIVNEQNLLGDSFSIVEDYEGICNYGIYFTDKSDSGTTALTLRDVYNNPDLQNPDFPIILTGQEVNTERNYDYIDLIPFGANNHGDYAVLDTEGIALEAGQIYEEAFTSNDVQSVAKNNEEITDADRLEASRQLYIQSIRKLRHSRRKIGYTLQIMDLPAYYNVGDKLRLQVISQILEVTTCSNYYKKLITVDDYFYISSMTETVTTDGHTTFDVTVEKYLYNNEEV